MAGPDDYAPYEMWLDQQHAWPSESAGEPKVISEMPPNYAASGLAKLVRWARSAPAGPAAQYPDEDSREDFVRTTSLGEAMAARACNMQPEHFHAVYGQYGVLRDVDPHALLAMLFEVVTSHLEQWDSRDRVFLADKIRDGLLKEYAIKEKP